MIKTQPPLRIFAAGSLRRAFVPWLESYRQRTGTDVIVDFGPAGLLRQRIEQGEKVDLFASANTQHPVALSQQQAVAELRLFAANRLCLTARRERVAEYDSWLDILRAPELALATSTPGSDPGGDYAQQLFDYVERFHPGEGQRIREKARHLVGGRQSVIVPSGQIAAGWLILQGMTDLFIGYQSNSQPLREDTRLQLFDIPEPYNVRADYMLARFSQSACELVNELCSEVGQSYLRQQGFLPPSA
ncbi:molybdate ABC transporter periplasmic molybdate-binding protein [Leminorella richardii]|uniref:Molybdate ABC transporter periplasmic molybdate-binding protein n=1 Tax=Leminorella richardii TaxID=158841 RepID=A0A2X4ULZ8_9GAMM|nr:substrate-binding domain-containing protein [Leminorella richardii]SQI40907.1 molybdate ABC transporter periplasmic molybdate-binding protein [Leminorella richardii]